MKVLDKKWLYLGIISLIWGSSFILIKKSLIGFSPFQVGALRIVLASLCLFIIGYKSVKTMSILDWKWILIAGLCSSFFAPFFFAIAQTELDSGITSILNSVAPLFTTLIGIIFFGFAFRKNQLLGVIIGLVGTVLLIMAGMEFESGQNYGYALFILTAALGYAFNINIIKTKLSHLSPLAVTTASFGVAFVPGLLVLLYTGVFGDFLSNPNMQQSMLYILVLAVLCTAIANVLFNNLIKLSSPVFAASVTYIIPLVAVCFGFLDGEEITVYQLLGGGVILFGVWLVNKKKRV